MHQQLNYFTFCWYYTIFNLKQHGYKCNCPQPECTDSWRFSAKNGNLLCCTTTKEFLLSYALEAGAFELNSRAFTCNAVLPPHAFWEVRVTLPWETIGEHLLVWRYRTDLRVALSTGSAVQVRGNTHFNLPVVPPSKDFVFYFSTFTVNADWTSRWLFLGTRAPSGEGKPRLKELQQMKLIHIYHPLACSSFVWAISVTFYHSGLPSAQ